MTSSTLRRATIAVTAGLAAALGLSGCSLLGQESATSLEVGDCLMDPNSEQVATVDTVDCAEPHDYEVYADKELPEGDFNPVTVSQEAADFCTAEFTNFVGLPYEESELEAQPLTPTAETWKTGDRLITCMITDPAGPSTGSLKGANR
ncbi:MAG: septum formation family protein [Pseudoclavibacter sp.]|nr:septum formation family protein [Pseudoclavibacter sp.]